MNEEYIENKAEHIYENGDSFNMTLESVKQIIEDAKKSIWKSTIPIVKELHDSFYINQPKDIVDMHWERSKVKFDFENAIDNTEVD